MELRIFQKGFNFSQDGPGNRLVYHLQGCNLRCPWCSNPEGMAFCGGGAYSVEALVDEVLRSRAMFFDGGGVTLTGGEATMQFEPVRELLSALATHGVHTALETNGASSNLPALFPYLNLLLLDCKHYDRKALKEATGAELAIWEQNFHAALDDGQAMAVRIPVIPGFNDGITHAGGFAKLLDSCRQAATIELLPYHAYGKTKWEQLGLPYAMPEDAAVDPAVILQMETLLQSRGFCIVHT